MSPAPKNPRVSESNTDHEMSSSKSIYETLNGSHKYIIEGFSMAKGMGVGNFMTSGKFRVGDGRDEANQEYVSVFLRLDSPGEVRASFEFKLQDQSGKEIHIFESDGHTTFNTERKSL
ncbi:hypothetical protein MKW94_019522 [Papaver nudicaule]|uniref:Uncharacterized protein n=1 Tax=Papaver nudicaule TaxID=74823 RepID=A0AA41VM32_PAPNU|nr:hypothetical protein [Papaver nudicaule]